MKVVVISGFTVIQKLKICFENVFEGRLKTARPPSARPAAPRLKEKTEIMAEEIMQARFVTIFYFNIIYRSSINDVTEFCTFFDPFPLSTIRT